MFGEDGIEHDKSPGPHSPPLSKWRDCDDGKRLSDTEDEHEGLDPLNRSKTETESEADTGPQCGDQGDFASQRHSRFTKQRCVAGDTGRETICQTRLFSPLTVLNPSDYSTNCTDDFCSSQQTNVDQVCGGMLLSVGNPSDSDTSARPAVSSTRPRDARNRCKAPSMISSEDVKVRQSEGKVTQESRAGHLKIETSFSEDKIAREGEEVKANLAKVKATRKSTSAAGERGEGLSVVNLSEDTLTGTDSRDVSFDDGLNVANPSDNAICTDLTLSSRPLDYPGTRKMRDTAEAMKQDHCFGAGAEFPMQGQDSDEFSVKGKNTTSSFDNELSLKTLTSRTPQQKKLPHQKNDCQDLEPPLLKSMSSPGRTRAGLTPHWTSFPPVQRKMAAQRRMASAESTEGSSIDVLDEDEQTRNDKKKRKKRKYRRTASSDKSLEGTLDRRSKSRLKNFLRLNSSESYAGSVLSSNWASSTCLSTAGADYDLYNTADPPVYVSTVTLKSPSSGERVKAEGVHVLSRLVRSTAALDYPEMTMEHIIRELETLETGSEQEIQLRLALITRILPRAEDALDMRSVVDCLKLHHDTIRQRAVSALEKLLLGKRHRKPASDLLYVIEVTSSITPDIHGNDLYHHGYLLILAACSLLCLDTCQTKGGLEEQLNRVANGPLLGRLIKGKGKVCDSGTFQLCKGVHQFFMDLSDVTTARSYHETDWFKALRHQTRRQNTLSNANFGQLVFRCFSAFCGIMAAAWDHLTEKLVQEVDRVLRAMAKLKVTEDVRAVSDFFLVRCLLHILNTCFSEHRPDVGRRTCNPPKVIAELLRTVLGSAGNKIRPVLIDQISYLPFHPSKHVRDIMSHVMTQYERPLSDIGVTHAEHHLAVASIRSGELTEDVVQEKGRPSCTWQKMEWRGPDNERLQGAMFVPQPKCLTANNRIEGCLKHATPSQQNEQHVQNLDMLHKFGSDPGAPYFLTLLAFQFHPMPCFYITENVDNKRLLCLLLDSREKKHWLSMTSLLNAACDVTAALTFLAERNIALRDVTTFNMICVTGPRGVVTRRSVKLADLGLSHEFCSESPYDNPEIRRLRDPGPVPIRWTPWEALFQGLYSDRSMVYSLGYVLYELFTHGCQPFSDMANRTTDDIIQLLFLRSPCVRPFHWPCIPDGVYHLIRHCTELRPDDRPKLEQVHSTLQRLMNTTTPEEPPNRRKRTTSVAHEWRRDEEYPPVSLDQEKRRHVPETFKGGITSLVLQLQKTDPDRYKNLRESSWVTSLNANVTDAELVPDAISVKKQEIGGQTVTVVTERLTPDYVNRVLPDVECRRHALPNVVAWKDQELENGFHQRQYEESVRLLDAVKRCRRVTQHQTGDALLNACLALARVVRVLHDQGMVHRDLRAANILVTRCDGKVLLARIGRIRQLSGLSYVIDEVFQDSKRWLSPEVLHNGIYTKENDIFMLGTTFWELFNARNRCGRDPAATARDLVPLVEFSKDQVADMVQEGVLLPEPPEIPSWLYNLICDCRHPDRKERPTIQRVISCLEEHCSADCSQLVAYMSRDVDSWPGPDDEAPSVPSRDSRWLLAKLGNSFKRRRTRVVSGCAPVVQTRNTVKRRTKSEKRERQRHTVHFDESVDGGGETRLRTHEDYHEISGQPARHSTGHVPIASGPLARATALGQGARGSGASPDPDQEPVYNRLRQTQERSMSHEYETIPRSSKWKRFLSKMSKKKDKKQRGCSVYRLGYTDEPCTYIEPEYLIGVGRPGVFDDVSRELYDECVPDYLAPPPPPTSPPPRQPVLPDEYLHPTSLPQTHPVLTSSRHPCPEAELSADGTAASTSRNTAKTQDTYAESASKVAENVALSSGSQCNGSSRVKSQHASSETACGRNRQGRDYQPWKLSQPVEEQRLLPAFTDETKALSVTAREERRASAASMLTRQQAFSIDEIPQLPIPASKADRTADSVREKIGSSTAVRQGREAGASRSRFGDEVSACHQGMVVPVDPGLLSASSSHSDTMVGRKPCRPATVHGRQPQYSGRSKVSTPHRVATVEGREPRRGRHSHSTGLVDGNSRKASCDVRQEPSEDDPPYDDCFNFGDPSSGNGDPPSQPKRQAEVKVCDKGLDLYLSACSPTQATAIGRSLQASSVPRAKTSQSKTEETDYLTPIPDRCKDSEKTGCSTSRNVTTHSTPSGGVSTGSYENVSIINGAEHFRYCTSTDAQSEHSLVTSSGESRQTDSTHANPSNYVITTASKDATCRSVGHAYENDSLVDKLTRELKVRSLRPFGRSVQRNDT